MNRKIGTFFSTTALGLLVSFSAQAGVAGWSNTTTSSSGQPAGQFFSPVLQQQGQSTPLFGGPPPQRSGLLSPSYTYQQQTTSAQNAAETSPLVAQANQVIAYWARNKGKYDKMKQKASFDAAYKDIEDSNGTLVAAAPYLNATQKQDALRTQWVLKFIQLKVLLQELTVLKNNMPYLINDVVSKRSQDVKRQMDGLGPDPIGKDWILEKRNLLQSLNRDFNANLIRGNSSFFTNLPDQLRGLDLAFQKAAEMDAYLNQQLQCFPNPNASFCAIKKPPAQKNVGRRSGFGSSFNRDRDDEYDDQGDFDDYEEPRG